MTNASATLSRAMSAALSCGMGAVLFDTLKLARRLEDAGFPPEAGGGYRRGPCRSHVRAELATIADFASLRTDLESGERRAQGGIAALRAELKAEFAAGRGELKADTELLRRDLTIRFGSVIVVAVGILLTAIRYLPAPH